MKRGDSVLVDAMSMSQDYYEHCPSRTGGGVWRWFVVMVEVLEALMAGVWDVGEGCLSYISGSSSLRAASNGSISSRYLDCMAVCSGV